MKKGEGAKEREDWEKKPSKQTTDLLELSFVSAS